MACKMCADLKQVLDASDVSSEPAPQMQRPAPRGRPPKEYIWCGIGYVHRNSLAPFSREEHEVVMLNRWREIRLQRYREDARGFRTRRILAQSQARIAKGIKPRRQKLKNMTLARSAAEEIKGGTDKVLTT